MKQSCVMTILMYVTLAYGKIRLPYVNKPCGYTDINNQIYWEIELKPSQDVVPMENERPVCTGLS